MKGDRTRLQAKKYEDALRDLTTLRAQRVQEPELADKPRHIILCTEAAALVVTLRQNLPAAAVSQVHRTLEADGTLPRLRATLQKKGSPHE